MDPTLPPSRRPVLTIVGSAGPLPEPLVALCEDLGHRAIGAGFRIATGGLDGVMEAASRGAHRSPAYREGDVIGVLPGGCRAQANPWVDIVIPTDMGMARNFVLVALGDVVISVRGGSGTLSEIAAAWQLGREVVALEPSGGWSQELAGRPLDARRETPIFSAGSPEEAVTRAARLTGLSRS